MKVKEMSIQDYLKENSQASLSRHLGVSQAAIHRAIKAKRKIFVVEDDEKVEAFEIRPFPHSLSRKRKVK